MAQLKYRPTSREEAKMFVALFAHAVRGVTVQRGNTRANTDIKRLPDKITALKSSSLIAMSVRDKLEQDFTHRLADSR